MADTAFQKQYRQEYVAGFEFKQSYLRAAVTTEHVRQGNEAVFLVADSGGAEARTRGVDGRIPARADNNNQYTATLVEWHDLVNKTSFNIFASQGNQRKIMQDTSLKVGVYGGYFKKSFDENIFPEFTKATGIAVESVAEPTGEAWLVQLEQAAKAGQAPADVSMM